MTEEQEDLLIKRSCEEIAAHLSLSEALQIIQGAIEEGAKKSVSSLTEEQKQNFYNKLFPQEEEKEQSDG